MARGQNPWLHSESWMEFSTQSLRHFQISYFILQLCWMLWSDSQIAQNHSPELGRKDGAATVVQKGKEAALILFRKEGKSNQSAGMAWPELMLCLLALSWCQILLYMALK